MPSTRGKRGLLSDEEPKEKRLITHHFRTMRSASAAAGNAPGKAQHKSTAGPKTPAAKDRPASAKTKAAEPAGVPKALEARASARLAKTTAAKPGCKAAAAKAARPGTKSKGMPAQAASPAKKPKLAPPKGKRRQPLASLQLVDGSRARTGDSVYVCMSDKLDVDMLADVERCVLCSQEGREEASMLECDACLRGFHLGCLDPPLEEVPEEVPGLGCIDEAALKSLHVADAQGYLENMPEGEWKCPDCMLGREPTASKDATPTAREELLSNRGWLALARIERAWRAPDGEQWVQLRWYEKPEATHVGRQDHHSAREVFLTEQIAQAEAGSLIRQAQVCTASQYSQAEGDDVFVCKYEYNMANQKFKPWRGRDKEGEDDEGRDWDPSDGDESEEDADAILKDGTFKPIYAFWAEKGLTAARNMRPGGGRGRRIKQGGEDWQLAQHQAGSAGQRAAAAQVQGTSLQQARARLALTAVPQTLPCREKERDQIRAFVEGCVTAGHDAGSCLYVSGVPGTGKTATVRQVVAELRGRVRDGDLPNFTFVEINSLRLASPKHVYTHLHEALDGCHLAPTAAAAQLEAAFSNGGGRRKGVTVVLVDEMDLLVTRKQTVLYNLFEWPMRKGSRLAIIGVANTMDLPERLLPRIASRLGGRRVVFQPYTRQQLETIASSRVDGLDCFEKRAIEYAARKVASVSGDLRRCLELLRRAAEIADEQLDTIAQTAGSAGAAATAGDATRVKMSHVDAAMNEMFQATHMQLLRNCCRLEKLVLAAMLLEGRAQGHTDAVVENVAIRLQHMCHSHSEASVCVGEVTAAASRLGAKRLILADPGARRLRMRMSLNLPADDLIHVLKSDEAIPWLKDLPL